MDILCIENENCFLFDSEFLERNADELAGGENINITSTKQNVWNREPISFEDVGKLRAKFWSETQTGMPERHFRLQVNAAYTKEFLQIEMSKRFNSDAKHSWAEHPYAVYDRMIDGIPIQDKVVRKNNDNASFVATLLRSVGNVHVPYFLGDIDNGFFNFGIHLQDVGVYLEWRIPESVMYERGYLARVESGRCTRVAKQTICFHVVSSAGANCKMCMKIFGKLPRKPFDDWTTSYLKICDVV